MDKEQLKRLVIAALLVAQRQYTNLLTPEMIAQFEELTSILHQESHGALNISVLDGHDEEPDVQQFINRNDSLAVLPASLTATNHASPKVNPGIQPVEPEAELFPHADLKTPHHSTKKRKASQSEKSISSSQRECAKRCRKACLSSQKVDSLKEWSDFASVDYTSSPLGVKAKSLRPVDHHTPLYCPSTVTKSRMPLAPPTIQK